MSGRIATHGTISATDGSTEIELIDGDDTSETVVVLKIRRDDEISTPLSSV